MSGAAATPLVGTPLCAIDVFPYEGNSYTITGGQILTCSVTKDLRGGGPGMAEIILAPGGPNGQGFPSWAQVITLQSLVVIAMSRGGHSNVVFVGNAAAVQEDQAWEAGRRVVRNTRIIAYDWQAWFSGFSWSALSFLAVTANLIVGEAVTGNPNQGAAIALLGSAAQNGNPSQIANGWFNKIMAGDQGVLAKTTMQYQYGNLKWPLATTAYFESYPGFPIFPASYYFISQAGSWMSKFQEILQEPWYEILIGTTPRDIWYPSQIAPNLQQNAIAQIPTSLTSGTDFNSRAMPNATPAYAGIVGRLQRLPDLTINAQSGSGPAGQPAYTFGNAASVDYWNSLPLFKSDTQSDAFIDATTSLSLDEYYNFFLINPTYLKQMIQLNTAAQSFSPVVFAGAANPAGVHRFGLHSYIQDMYWFADWAQVAAQSNGAQGNLAQSLYLGLTARIASYFTPLPLMRTGSMRMPLRPDIFVGCRWTATPFRGGNPWQFYIKGVRHEWRFGGPSTTELELDRGLPAAVYDDAILLCQVLQGAVDFPGGTEVPIPIPASELPALQLFSTAPGDLKTVLGEIAGIYGHPQAK